MKTLIVSGGNVGKEILNKTIKNNNFNNIIVNYVDPVIGAHSGPGTLALFFMSKNQGR